MPLDEWQEQVLEAAMGERTDGRWASKFVGLSAPRQNGKALDVQTPILTVDRGFVALGDLRVGDRVLHPSGVTTRVVAKSEVMRDHDCFRVTSVDGRSVVADAGHLWDVIDKRQEISRTDSSGRRVRSFRRCVLTTTELAAGGLSRYISGGRTSFTGGRSYVTNEYRFILPQVAAVDLDGADLPLDPYLFGAWLGDGTSTSAALTSGDEDLAHWVEAVAACGYTPTVGKSQNAWRIGITCEPGVGRHGRSFGGRLKELGVFGNKYVPEAYLTASLKDRAALLQGMMDTDGCIAKRGQAEFCSTNRRLADAVLFLARSLGWRAVLSEGRATLNGRDCGPKYRVQFSPKLEDHADAFRLPRKLARVGADGGKGRLTLSIKSIERVESRPVQCIQVDAPDGLFLAGRDLMPTHNSQLIVARALAGVLLFGEKMVIISAHDTDTAREVWKRLIDVVESNPTVAARVTGRMDAINREFLSFGKGHDRQTIKLKARRASGSRGFSADCLLLDEAQILGKQAWGSIVPTMSARPNPQLWLFGTPPTEEDDPFAFTRVRESAMAKKVRHAWLEWSAGPTDDLNDPETWARANPSFGVRVSLEACEDDRSAMDDAQFALERLGVWPSDARSSVFGDAWAACAGEELRPPMVALAIAAGVELPGRPQRCALVAAGVQDDLIAVKPLQVAPGIGWVVERAAEIAKQHNVPVIIDGRGPAAVLITPLEQLGVKVYPAKTSDLLDACAMTLELVRSRRLRHASYPELDAAASGAIRRDVQDRWALGRKGPSDIAPLEAAVLAAWKAVQPPEAPKQSAYADGHDLIVI